MNEFKLIALRPLEGCGTNFKKILHENETYVFITNMIFPDIVRRDVKLAGKS